MNYFLAQPQRGAAYVIVLTRKCVLWTSVCMCPEMHLDHGSAGFPQNSICLVQFSIYAAPTKSDDPAVYRYGCAKSWMILISYHGNQKSPNGAVRGHVSERELSRQQLFLCMLQKTLVVKTYIKKLLSLYMHSILMLQRDLLYIYIGNIFEKLTNGSIIIGC